MNKGFSIAIDGPVASGKGTIAQALANKLNGSFINTGAMYRCVALICLNKDVDINDEKLVEELLPNLEINFDDEKVLLNGSDVTERVKEPDIANASAIIATYAGVRSDLVKKQQEIAEKETERGKVVVMEGRDIGTRVLPNADFKIFLTAEPKIRAERRQEQFAQKGIDKELTEVIEETLERDRLDTGRKVDPLPSDPASLGYFVLDNTKQSEEESINIILEEIKRKGLKNDSL